MVTMPWRLASRGSDGLYSCLSNRTCPADGDITPERILSSVDLPAPFSPNRPRISPRRTSSETSLSAVTPGKCLVRPSTASSTSLDGAATASAEDKRFSRLNEDGRHRGRARQLVSPAACNHQSRLLRFADALGLVEIVLGDD